MSQEWTICIKVFSLRNNGQCHMAWKKGLVSIKKETTKCYIQFVSTLDYHTLLSYEFYFQAQSFLDKQTVAKPTSSTAVSDACVAKLFAYRGCRKNGQRFKFTLTFHSCPLLSTDTVHFWVQCPVLCTLGSFRKKDIKHIILFLLSFLFVCAYLWMIYLSPPICFKQIHR